MHAPPMRLAAVALLLLAAGLVPLPRREVQVRIGSKKFTESVILGEALRLLAAEAGLETTHSIRPKSRSRRPEP